MVEMIDVPAAYLHNARSCPRPVGRFILRMQSSLDEEVSRSEEHTSELQSHHDIVCRLLLVKKKSSRSAYMGAKSRDMGWSPGTSVRWSAHSATLPPARCMCPTTPAPGRAALAGPGSPRTQQ